MALLIALRSEVLKTKRTASLYLTLFAAAFGPFMSLLDLVLDGVGEEHKATIFNELLTTKFMMAGAVVFPLFIILISTLLPQIEYRNNAWKQIFTSPQGRGHVFLAKFINIHLLIMVFLGANLLLKLVVAVILHFLEPTLNVLHQPVDGYQILTTRATSYVALLAIGAIQFWLGLRCKNFMVPIAVGLSLWFMGSLLVIGVQSNLGLYFPYSFHIYSSFPQLKPDTNTYLWISVSLAVLVLLLGYLDFKRKEKE